jgi:hypothetical protein
MAKLQFLVRVMCKPFSFFNYLTPWNLVLEKTTVTQLLKNLPAFYEANRSLLCQEESATGLHPKPE